MKKFIVSRLHQTSSGWSNNKNEMGEACSRYGGAERLMRVFCRRY